eukprot:c4320_g1_i1 orf=275-559(+)
MLCRLPWICFALLVEPTSTGVWNESFGFLVGVDVTCTWGTEFGFAWLHPGQTRKYLGFQVGPETTPAQQFAPVLASIRRKLSHWSAAHLSLAQV